MPRTIAKPYSAVKKPENRVEMESFAAGKNIPADKTILKLHYDDNGALLSKTVEEAPSPWASFARAVPTALPANIAGAGAGVAIGGAGTAVGGPWVGIPAGFAAAGGTGMLVDKLINKGIEKVRPAWAEVLETDRQINPKASLAGSLISGAGAQKNLSVAGLKALAKSGGSAEKFGQLLRANPDIAALGGKSGDIVKGALTHVGTSAGLGVAQDLAMQKLSGSDDLNFTSALESGALMPFIGGGRLRFGEKMAARPAEMVAERMAALKPRAKSQFGIDTDSNARHDAYVKYAELVSKAKPGEVPAILEDLKNTWGITASEKDLATAADTINAARTKKLKEEAEKAKNTADKLSDSIKSGDLAANGLDPELVDHVKKSDLRDHGKPLTTEQAENLLLKPEFADIVAPYLESFKAKKAEEAAAAKAKEDAKAAAASTAPKTARDRLLEAKAAGKLTSNELDPELVKHIQKSPIRFNGKALTKEQAELMLSDPAFADDVAPHLESYVKAQQEALAPEVKPTEDNTTAVAPVDNAVGKPAEANPAQLQLQRLHSGELKNMTDFDSLEAAVNDGSLPVLYNPEGLEAEAAHFAVQKAISTVEKQEGMPPGELTAADNKSILAKGPFALGRNMNEAVLMARKLAYNLAKRVKDGNKNLIHTDDVDAVVAANKARPSQTAPVTAKSLEGDSTSVPVEPTAETPPLTGQPVEVAKPTVPKPTVKTKGPTHNLVTGDKIVVAGKEGEIVGFVTNSPNRARVRFADGVKLVNVGKMKKPETPTTVEAPATPAEPPKTGQPVAEAPAAPISPNADMELRAKIGKLAEAHKAMADDASGNTDTMAIVDGMSNDLVDNHGLTPDQVSLINRRIAAELDSSGDIVKAVDAALGVLRGSSNTGKPFQPLPLKGNVGAGLGGVGDMARAVYNVTGRTVESAGQTLGRINKGFKEGRGAEGRPDFIRSSAVDTLRPAYLKMNLDREGKYDGDQLLGRLVNTMAPAEKEVLLGNGLEKFLKGSRRTPEEVARFVEENGPQVEVKKLYAPRGKTDKSLENDLVTRQIEISHELDTRVPNWRQFAIQDEGTATRLPHWQIHDANVLPPSERVELERLLREYDTLQDRRSVNDASLGKSNESATARYTMVNPKPLKNMPGAVDILVRVPLKKGGEKTLKGLIPHDEEIDLSEFADLGLKFTSQHYPNEGNNLLAHVRGYMETLPDSRKVFHVFEVQSDWAQQRRKGEEHLAEHMAIDPDENYRVAREKEFLVPGDPLLKDYNRLALKAAIEHAYREGADAIAISDAETAMMSERHDQHTEYTPVREFQVDTFERRQEAAKWKAEKENSRRLQIIEDEKGMPVKAVGLEKSVSQEPGMRFNYDPNPATAGRSNKPGALHELAAEITKYPGERVSFGPHQNAFKDTVWQAEQNQRSDLIFKNPDGTPKTDITAQLYPIDKVAAKLELSPFAVAGKGPRGQELYMFPLHTIALDGAKALFKLAGRAFNAATVRAGAGTGERLAATQGPSGAYVLDVTSPTFYRSERQYRNHFLEPIDDAGRLKLSSDQWKTIGQYADDVRELGASPINLTADEKRGYDFIRESYDRSRIAQIASGKLINGRAANLTADFVPRTVMNQKVRSILNGPDSPERSHYIDLYRNWAKHQDPRLTQAQIDNMLADVLGKDPFGGKRNPTFAPLEQAEGIGLPPEMREDNALTVAKYYAIRSATGLAWHKAVETDPIAARIFGELPKADAEKNTVGYDTPEILPSHTNASDYLVTGYGPSEYARNLTGDPYLEAYRQDMAMGSHQNYDWVDNMTAVVNGFKLGPKTAMRDVISSLLGSQLEIAHLNEVPKLLKAVSDVYYGRSTAVKAGAVKRHSAAESAIEESLRKTAGRIADVMRKYQGQDLMEKGVREILFEYGRGIAESRYLQNDTEFLESYGSKQWKKFDAKDHNDLLDRMATKFVEQLQGSYSPDYLPRSLTRGAGPSWTKATLSLSRWGIERFRRYRQTVVEPLAKGDARPFLRSTAAYLGLAAPAVYALEELLTEKKPLYMTNGEFFNLLNDDGTPSKAKMDEFAYTVLGRAQLVGMAGIFTGALYQMMQARHGEHTSGFNNPGWGAIEDMGARIGQYWNAYSGSDFFTHLHELPYETLMNETQSLRLLRGAMDNKEDSGNREEQIYKRVTGQTKFKVGSVYRSDPFNPVSKMKKAETVEDIMAQEEPLARMYEGAPPQEPSNFPRRIRHDFGYYNFLDKIQGDGAGEAQLEKDMSGQAFNPIRSMVAKRAFIKAKARNLADGVAP